MALRSYRTFQGLILAGWGLFFLMKLWDGTILYYINRRFIPLILISGLIFFILAQTMLKNRLSLDADNNDKAPGTWRWNLFWLVFPLLLGFLVPVRPLGSASVSMRGINTGSFISMRDGAKEAQTLRLAPNQRSILDWMNLFNFDEDSEQMINQKADLVGFVVPDAKRPDERFLLARYVITCCVADASALGINIIWPESRKVVEGEWVRVKGEFTMIDIDGNLQPAIKGESVENISEPDQPYLFP